MTKILVVDNHTSSLDHLKSILKDFDFSVINKLEFKSEIATPYDVVILTGGSGVDSVKNHKEDYLAQIDFIKSTNKKVIGICLGCEIVATAFGCTIEELPQKAKGIIDIIYQGERIPVYESHRFAITDTSPDIDILATSSTGIEIIRHKEKPIMGLQFHPESFIDKTKGKEIFLELIAKDAPWHDIL
ncbi:MAG: glutamine amidotransferase-related protein [Candidatus Paceibacterota bacterium]